MRTRWRMTESTRSVRASTRPWNMFATGQLSRQGERVETLWSNETSMTRGANTKLVQLLVDCYREEPDDIATRH